MRLKINLIILLFFLTACNNLDFVYKNDIKIKNPLYQKTAFILSGVNSNVAGAPGKGSVPEPIVTAPDDADLSIKARLTDCPASDATPPLSGRTYQ